MLYKNIYIQPKDENKNTLWPLATGQSPNVRPVTRNIERIFGIYTQSHQIENIHDERNLPNRRLVQSGLVAKNTTLSSSWESNLRPYKSSAVLCQMRHEGRCLELGHEFCIYNDIKL